MPEVACLLLIFNLCIGDGSLAYRAPVDDAASFVDPSFFIQTAEYFFYGFNGSGYISDETKQKIMQAVEELNYKPNELAQNLFRNKSGFIGIVVKNLSHPFMASLVKHVENNLYTNGYKCMLCEVGDNPNRIEEFVEMLQRNVMDGIICCAHAI